MNGPKYPLSVVWWLIKLYSMNQHIEIDHLCCTPQNLRQLRNFHERLLDLIWPDIFPILHIFHLWLLIQELQQLHVWPKMTKFGDYANNVFWLQLFRICLPFLEKTFNFWLFQFSWIFSDPNLKHCFTLRKKSSSTF